MAAIFLVGARAAGKTTVGLELARLLDCPFTDTDQHLRQSLGRSVAEVVAAEGWPGFRARESAALREVTGAPRFWIRKTVASCANAALSFIWPPRWRPWPGGWRATRWRRSALR